MINKRKKKVMLYNILLVLIKVNSTSSINEGIVVGCCWFVEVMGQKEGVSFAVVLVGRLVVCETKTMS